MSVYVHLSRHLNHQVYWWVVKCHALRSHDAALCLREKLCRLTDIWLKYYLRLQFKKWKVNAWRMSSMLAKKLRVLMRLLNRAVRVLRLRRSFFFLQKHKKRNSFLSKEEVNVTNDCYYL